MKTTKLLVAIAAFGISLSSFGQVKIGDNPTTINPGSVLELESTNKGLLMPRISLTNTTTWGLLGTPAAGMHVYNSNTGITSTNPSYPTLRSKIGEYYWDGTGWVAHASVNSTFISVTGNTQQIDVGVQYLAYQNELIDKGGDFDPVTSTFTAPKDGIYLITTYVRVSGDPSYQRGRIGFSSNVEIVGGANTVINSGIGPLDDWGFASGASQYQLTAGQQVRIQFEVNPGGTGNYQRTLDIKRLEITKLSD